MIASCMVWGLIRLPRVRSRHKARTGSGVVAWQRALGRQLKPDSLLTRGETARLVRRGGEVGLKSGSRRAAVLTRCWASEVPIACVGWVCIQQSVHALEGPARGEMERTRSRRGAHGREPLRRVGREVLESRRALAASASAAGRASGLGRARRGVSTVRPRVYMLADSWLYGRFIWSQHPRLHAGVPMDGGRAELARERRPGSAKRVCLRRVPPS